MGDILRFTGSTTADLYPDDILSDAIGNMDAVVIMGYDKEGNEFFASSIADGAEVLWLAERCKHKLMQITDEEEQ